MNRLIVWSEERKEFMSADGFNDCVGLTLDLELKNFDDDVIPNGYKIFWSIGKTDIEGNKIYADSSIVEFDYLFEEGWLKMIGNFYYDNEKLRFNIRACEVTKSERKIFYNTTYDLAFIRNLKKIGTLQENQELLNA